MSLVYCKGSMAGLFCWMNEYREDMNVFMKAIFHIRSYFSF